CQARRLDHGLSRRQCAPGQSRGMRRAMPAARPPFGGNWTMFAILARPAWGAVALVSLAAAAIGGPARADGPDPSLEMVTTVSLARDYEVTRAVKLGLNKSIVVDMPRDARDVLVSNPSVADAVIRTPRRIYLTGIAV